MKKSTVYELLYVAKQTLHWIRLECLSVFHLSA